MGKFEAKELLKKEGAKAQDGVCAAVASNSCFKSNLHSRAPKISMALGCYCGNSQCSSQFPCVVGWGVAGTGGDEALDGVDGLDAAAGADGSAVERGGSAAEIELALQRPTLEQPIDKSRVKNVARTRGVKRLHPERGCVMEAR